ncbi:hypothetical protein quinque_011244 [Culex quinquefasciatus]
MHLFRIFALLIAVLVTTSARAEVLPVVEVCSVCRCLEDVEESTVAVECLGESLRHDQQRNNNRLDLRGIVWPVAKDRNGTLKVRAYFADLELHYLPKLPTSISLIELHFENDSIKSLLTEPFDNFKNLEVLSITNNALASLDKDFFTASNTLLKLDLSNNSLTAVTALERAHFQALESIDLSHNKLKAVSHQLVRALESVSLVRLEACDIYNWDSGDRPTRWQVLNLNRNKLTVVSATTFASLERLEALYLAYNEIQHIDPQAFEGLKLLERLDLSYNHVTNLEANLVLPEALTMVNVAGNGMERWPFDKISQNLRILEIQNNAITDLSTGQQVSVIILNASNNRLDTFAGDSFPEVTELDLSFNALTDVPRNLGKQLRTLVLDGNPMQKVFFETEVPLSLLSLNSMPELTDLDAFSFWKLVGAESEKEQDCVEIRISNCPKLRHIDAKAFEETSICKLDLSYNQLTSIPQTLVNWDDLHGGINLQGNPLNCDCTEQWLVDVILPKLYDQEDLQYLLDDLRCASPANRAGKRLVKYLNHRDAFCGGGGSSSGGPRMERLQMESGSRRPSAAIAVDSSDEIAQAGFLSRIICSVDDPDCLHAHEGHGLVALGVIVAVTLILAITMVVILVVRRLRPNPPVSSDGVWLMRSKY